MGKRIREWSIALGGIGAAVAIAFCVLVIRSLTQGDPEFDSLQTHPNPQLHGTVAYYDSATSCIRAIAVAGTPSKQVLCVPAQSAADAAKYGKHVGVHVVWLDGGKLELTMFRMLSSKGTPEFEPAWRKVVDVATLAVTDIPLSGVPKSPTPVERPVVDPQGNRLQTSSQNGHAVVSLTSVTGQERTLLDVQGAFDSYRLAPAFFSPDFEYVLSDDGRVLITTLGATPRTLSLTGKLSSGYGYDEIDWFAVTGWDLLSQ